MSIVCVCCVWCLALKDKDATLTPGRKVKRSRSKSPFRSFRWKKSGGSSGAKSSAVSDDEDNLAAAASRFLSIIWNKQKIFVLSTEVIKVKSWLLSIKLVGVKMDNENILFIYKYFCLSFMFSEFLWIRPKFLTFNFLCLKFYSIQNIFFFFLN